MKDTSYAYAVANVRAREPYLLSKSFMEQLADCTDYDEVKNMLADIGSDSFNEYMEKTWDFLKEIAPDTKELEFLIVKNDFHNLKAIIKGMISGHDGLEYCIKPCIIKPDNLSEAINQRDFESLPSWINKTAEEGYKLLTSTMDGQLFDMFVDKASLEAIKKFAHCGESDFVNEFAELFVAITNIKIAVRVAGSKKIEGFCECGTLDIDELKKAVLKGIDAVWEYIRTTKYSALYNNSAGEFERECDNMLTEFLDGARHTSFGPQPLICYYFARETEWKMLRIITSCKHMGLDREIITERMRELYV